MRIMIDARTATPHFPGIGRYVRSLGAALAAQLGTDDELAALLPPPDAAGAELLSNTAIKRFATCGSVFTKQSRRTAAHALAAYAPAVLHLPFPLVRLQATCPTVVTLHDMIPLNNSAHGTWAARLAWLLIGSAVLQRTTKIIAISQSVADKLAQNFGADYGTKTTVVHHGVEPHFHPAPAPALQTFRQRRQLPDSYLLYVGSDRPHKNIITLLRLLAQDLAGELPQLVVAGMQSDTPALRKNVTKLGVSARVKFVGALPEADLPLLYGAARMLLFPSLDEGFGLPLLEALACGTPVVCADTPIFREIGGAAVVAVPPLDVAAWHLAITQLLRDPQHQCELRQRGLKHAAPFTWERTAAATREIYRQAGRGAGIPACGE